MIDVELHAQADKTVHNPALPHPDPIAEIYTQYRLQGKTKRESYILASNKRNINIESAGHGAMRLERKYPEIIDRLTHLQQSSPMLSGTLPQHPDIHSNPLQSLDDFIRYYRAVCCNMDTRDPDALKAAAELAKLLDIQGVVEQERRKVDPSRILDVFLRGHLAGYNPAHVLSRAYNYDAGALARALLDALGLQEIHLVAGNGADSGVIQASDHEPDTPDSVQVVDSQ